MSGIAGLADYQDVHPVESQPPEGDHGIEACRHEPPDCHRRRPAARHRLFDAETVDLTGKVRTTTTAGGHHRISESEIERLIARGSVDAPPAIARKGNPGLIVGLSGRNKLRGYVDEVRVDGLLAQIRLRIGDQMFTAVVTADAVAELKLKRGDDAVAIVKSTEVMIAREAPGPRRPGRAGRADKQQQIAPDHGKPYTETMQLRNARLCLDCEEVHDATHCPACASESFAFITRWVPSPSADAAGTRRGSGPRSARNGAIRRSRRPPVRPRYVPATAERPFGSRQSHWRLVKRGAVGLALFGLAGWAWKQQSQRPPAPSPGEDPDNHG